MEPFIWYIPSWNGDIRFEAEGPDRTIVKVIEPTAGEIARLQALSSVFQKHKLIQHPLWDDKGDPKLQVSSVQTSILKVAAYLVQDYAPGRATLTAIQFSDQNVEAFEAAPGMWNSLKETLGLKPKGRKVEPAPLAQLEEKDDSDEDAYRRFLGTADDDVKPKAEPKPKPQPKAKPKPEKAVTVKRPTICCPMCIDGPISPAAEVLFAFLTEEEKQEYIENDHSLVVTGGITGYRYLVSHRHGKWAQHFGKMCRDLDNGVTLHFHDHTIPPEEEVLQALLMLRFRENWVRTYGSGAALFGDALLPNPFGGSMDGTQSTMFTYQFGQAIAELEELFTGVPAKRNDCSFGWSGGSSFG